MERQDEKMMFDQKAGRVIVVEPETRWDRVSALLSMGYLLIMIGVFFWGLFDVWIGQYTLVRLLGYSTPEHLTRLNESFFRLLAYAFIGGGLGGTVNGIRSLLTWHVEWSAFQQRYIWKYITWPWLGTALALIVFALVRSGIAVIGGEMAPDDSDIRQSLSTLVMGILAGYGAREVFIWLDARVSRLFRVSADEKREVPDLIGLTPDEAEARLEAGSLQLGEVEQDAAEREEEVGKVIRQAPGPKQVVVASSPVNITVGARIPGDGFAG